MRKPTKRPPPNFVDWESDHRVFRTIWQAAHTQWEAEQLDRHRRFSSRMAALVLAHAAYEGFINEALRHLRPEVAAEEQTYFRGKELQGLMGKTRFLATELGLVLNRSARPYSTVAELHAWRNDLVHPRSVRTEGRTTALAYARRVVDPGPVVFAKLRPAFAKRCFDDVDALAQLLLIAASSAGRYELSHLGEQAFWGPSRSGQGSLRE